MTGLILVNFDPLTGAVEPSPLVLILPGIILGSGVLGLVWAEVLRRRGSDAALTTSAEPAPEEALSAPSSSSNPI